ncbi:MAG: orotate phosphoribosyltransferase [Pseudomonadota bacterium]|jgi:orotate phosphoribosyltransferase
MERDELAVSILSVARLRGEFRLRSGATSAEYFDKYRFESRPDLLRAIARHLAPLVPPGTEVLAGLELGGVPIATALSLETGLPVAFVRKEAKSYGTCRVAEGAEVANRRVLIVEDVVTSGGQIVKSTEELRALGAAVSCAVCVIDREAGGVESLAQSGLRLLALFTKSELEASTAEPVR